MEIKTHRLDLVPWNAELANDFVALVRNPDVIRFGYGTPPTEGAALAQLSEMVQEWETNGFGAYAIRDRETGSVGGYTGVHVPRTLPGLFPALEVGVRVIPEWWKRGVAFEAIAPVIDFGFDVLNAQRLVGVFLPANKGARTVNAGVGMTFRQHALHPRTAMLLEVHEVTRDDWIDARSQLGL
ncbi:GNAT family N-acetyltransferase [Micromonospora chersina]|uniref:GNAT family N-acetyltransferase n=1 Tax=Micromonospora chersina TaxID=47854 RepID=UPI003407151D